MSPAPVPTSADLLKLARRRAGLSQAELARLSGTPRSVIGRWERGEVEPGLESLRAAVRLCGLDLSVALVAGGDSAPTVAGSPALGVRHEDADADGPGTRKPDAEDPDRPLEADPVPAADPPGSTPPARAPGRTGGLGRPGRRGRSESRTTGPGPG